MGWAWITEAQTAAWSVDDLVKQEGASDFVFSPDGKKLAWVKTRPSEAKDRFVRNLYLTRLDAKEGASFKTLALTRGDDSERSPVFSHDGELIYFLSSRGEKSIWAMSLYGGEAYAIDSFEVSPQGLRPLGGHSLVFVAEDGETLYEKELNKKKDNVVVVEDTAHFKASQVYRYDLKEKKLLRLTDNRYPMEEYAFSKDGRWLVSSHILSPHYGADGKPSPKVYLWDLSTGKKTEILSPGFQTPGNFAFSADGRGFYFGTTQSSNPEWQGAGIGLLYYFDISTQKAQNVPLNWAWGMGRGFEVVGNDVIVSLANGPTLKLQAYLKNGSTWTAQALPMGTMDERINLAHISEDQKQAVFVYSTASVPPQYWHAHLLRDRKGLRLEKTTELIKLNLHWNDKPKAKSEIVRWKGANEDEITGILYYPFDYQAGRAYPLMVAIHGGPAAADLDQWSDRWAYYHQLLAQRGMFILKPNYHGSSNHGQDFVESIKKKYYDQEMEDILKGIDFLANKGLINKDSLAVMGWSNGAILTTMLTVRYPSLFKAAGAGAGDVNWTSDYGTCQFGVTFDQSYFGGAPWDDVNGKFYNEAYIIKSPLFEMEKVKTPTIIFHGSEDRAVPRDQGWEYYRALQQVGQAPVRFLWFPGQPHGLQKLSHQRRKITEEMAWFEQYLFGNPPRENEAFKENSPLAVLLQKEKHAHQNGLWGHHHQGLLIPEVAVIKADSLAIGIFEVTNAQFAAFQPSHSYSPPSANHPVTGIPFAQAQAYANWLSEKTGEAYRLPNAQEAKALQAKAEAVAPRENTLAYWAGFDITPREVPLFRQKLNEIKTSLLTPAGTFGAVTLGKAKVYDLGGNVAEYYQKADGEALYGFAADDFVEANASVVPSESKLKGFRIVKVLAIK
ncbi:MAG: prolyl oligopeptidase family serine peptidase [Microscillaceae bacterium]